MAHRAHLSLVNDIVEVGNTTTIMTYSIVLTEETHLISATMPNTSLFINLPLLRSTAGTVSNNVLFPNTTNTQIWTLTTTDNTLSTITNTASLTMIYPYFYGVSSTATSSASGINSIIGDLTKNTIQEQQNFVVPLSGSNVCIYFLYDSSYGDLNYILDGNQNDITSNFTLYTLNIGSPNGYWVQAEYNVYVYTGTGSTPILTNVSPFTVYYQFGGYTQDEEESPTRF